MAKKILTEEDIEAEIERLSSSDAVRLAQEERRLKYRRRQRLYMLRYLEKRGRELQSLGITMENIEMMAEFENM